ncbi:hypothetical protein BKA61DRAFT_601698 [Leptodontidium sp. MPI-SDFR-AT-0119]|nr:hypothetical protein BKA61DRAFT_601698 [Leptodontidium sp. MPI-SDFR-AT-0119]
MVPCYFEKSIVAILIVLKVGGASVPLEPTHPAVRREKILKQVEARIGLASSLFSNLAHGRYILCLQCAEIDQGAA